MSLLDVLDILFLQPLMVIYGHVYAQIEVLVPNPGWALIIFSVVLNLALLPVYFQMERKGREGLRSRAIVDEEVRRMKAHFTGRELYFYIRTIHRHFGYRPISVVFASADLYLQILVFATVYRFIASLPVLDGAAFAGIPDLGRPDGLLFGANLLPILMTIANVVSAVVYGHDRSKRRQAFGLAGLFLLLLYSSPSGLVLYWTSNNVFSLIRNLVEHKLIPLLPAPFRHRLVQVASHE